jgi:GNAT superfamily N-acetyltransferase
MMRISQRRSELRPSELGQSEPSPWALRRSITGEAELVSGVLTEAASWLEQQGAPLWRPADIAPAAVREDVDAGSYVLASAGGDLLGVMRITPNDPPFWPDAAPAEALYVHRLAVRRAHAGGAVSLALLNYACREARALGCPYVRLDCESKRSRLRSFYERHGFVLHSEREVPPYHVARYQKLVTAPLRVCSEDEAPVADAELSELLTTVYVDEGFTDEVLAARVFQPTEVRARGEILHVRHPEDEELMALLILAPPSSPARRFAGPDEAELHLLATAREHRGAGAGRALVEAAITRAQRSGYRRLLLWTQPAMYAAQRLYAALGFRRAPERDFSQHGRDFLFFQREL